MKKFYTFFALLSIIVLAIGCSNSTSPLATDTNDQVISKSGEIIATPPVREITYDIFLINSEYDAELDQTTFTYSVTSNPGGGPAISHWVIEFAEDCGGADIMVGSNDPALEWCEEDPTTGVRGVKFDTGYDDQEIRFVTLILAGNWGTGATTIAVKAGNGFVSGETDGPVCGVVEEEEETFSIGGTLFFDINGDGIQGVDEPGLPGLEVTLSDGTIVVTDENGEYLFEELEPGEYTVSTETFDGTTATTPESVDVVIVENDETVNFGNELDLTAFCQMSADGFTIGYWKNNLKKAIDGKTRGIQVPADVLQNYVSELGSFALAPLNFADMQDAYNTLNAHGADALLLLSKQLAGSEFNYMNEAYIGGNELLTWMFVYYGEYAVAHADNFSRDELLYVKDWFDAYNNSHGGLIIGPDCVE